MARNSKWTNNKLSCYAGKTHAISWIFKNSGYIQEAYHNADLSKISQIIK